MQHRITKPSNLLNKHGELIQKGYATSPILKYNRKDTACKLRLKEWDYYLIYNDDHALAITIGKSSPILLISATIIDFNTNAQTTKSLVRLVSNKRLSMPETSLTGNIIYQDCEVKLSIKHHKGKRELYLFIKDFNISLSQQMGNLLREFIDNHNPEPSVEKADLEVCVTLSHELGDSMVIATPFKQCSKEFYYNQKIVTMPAMGHVTFGNQIMHFTPDHSFGLLDWGRGIWPYKTTWYWSASQGIVYGNLFGFNLGYGFGDTSAATENMLFYNGIASKLDYVRFHIPKNENNEYEYMKPWTILSSDHRIEMTFTPILDRSVSLSAIILSTNQHQVFGKFTGTATLDDGTIVYLNDFLGFAEHVENRW